MLYKIAEGCVQETRYGLALARVILLPTEVLEKAEIVAQKLEQHVHACRKTSAAVIRERRRKLILNLKEHLVHAKNSSMGDEVLAAWLRELQREFVTRMTAIDAEAEASIEDEDDTSIDSERTITAELVPMDDSNMAMRGFGSHLTGTGQNPGLFGREKDGMFNLYEQTTSATDMSISESSGSREELMLFN